MGIYDTPVFGLMVVKGKLPVLALASVMAFKNDDLHGASLDTTTINVSKQ